MLVFHAIEMAVRPTNSEITVGVVFFLIGVVVGGFGITGALIIRWKAKRPHRAPKESPANAKPNQAYEMIRNPGTVAVTEDPVCAVVF